jgi:hypothetical protein
MDGLKDGQAGASKIVVVAQGLATPVEGPVGAPTVVTTSKGLETPAVGHSHRLQGREGRPEGVQ